MRRDVMACGCWWERCPSFGDMLVQCARHKAGAVYEGGVPMTGEETAALVDALRDAGLDATPLAPNRGSIRGSDHPATAPDANDPRKPERANGFEPSTFSLGNIPPSDGGGADTGKQGESVEPHSPTGDRK